MKCEECRGELRLESKGANIDFFRCKLCGLSHPIERKESTESTGGKG